MNCRKLFHSLVTDEDGSTHKETGVLIWAFGVVPLLFFLAFRIMVIAWITENIWTVVFVVSVLVLSILTAVIVHDYRQRKSSSRC